MRRKSLEVWEKIVATTVTITMVASLVPTSALAEAVVGSIGAADANATESSASDAVTETPAATDAATDAVTEAPAVTDAATEAPAATETPATTPETPTPTPAAADDQQLSPQSTVDQIDSCAITNGDGSDLTSLGVGSSIRVYAAVSDEWGDDTELLDEEYGSLTYQWYQGTSKVTYASSGDDYSGYAPVAGATSRSFAVTDAQLDGYLACKVTYGSGAIIWTSSSTPVVTDGKVTLADVSVAGKAKVGSTLTATAVDESGAAVSSGVTYQWQTSDTSSGTYVDISGAASATLATDGLAGKYVKVIVSSRTVVTSAAFGPIAAPGSAENESRLAAAIAALQNDTATSYSGWYPNPTYGSDANVRTMLGARLAALGFDDVSARVTSVSWTAPADPAQSGAIDISSGSSNGTVTFFFLAPADKTVTSDYSALRQFVATFELTCGDATDEYTPGRAATLAWDEGKVQTYLETQAAGVALPASVASGAASVDVTSETLPSTTLSGTTKTVAVSWTSSNPSVAKVVSGYDYSSWDLVQTVTYTHAAVPLSATLTATYSLTTSYGNEPTTTVTKKYPVAVAEKSAATELQVRAQLTKLLAQATAVDFTTGSAVDAGAVTDDLQLSTTRDLGVDGKVYQLSYVTSNSSAIAINGYHAVVTRPLEGDSSQPVTITAKLTYDGVTVTRDLGPYTLAPVTNGEIDQAVSLMERAKAGYSAALLGTNASASAVTSSLDPFMEVSADSNGSLVWARSVQAETGAGIIADDIEGYDPMGSEGWRTFKSSRPDVLSHETLQLTQPTYNTDVTISSSLTYERYRTLAAAHPEDVRLQSLVNQAVSATVGVTGTSGRDDPNVGARLSTTVRVIGPDASGTDVDWVGTTAFSATAGQTAADSSVAVFKGASLTYTFSGGYLSDITSPYTGVKLGWNASTGKYWQFFVNGVSASVGAASYYLKDGDAVVWYYSAWGDSPSTPTGGVVYDDPRASLPSYGADWPQTETNGSVTSAATPTAGARALWATLVGGGSSTSSPLIVNGKVYVAVGSSFMSGSAAGSYATKLVRIDATTGVVEATGQLAGSISYTSRPLYADGMVFVAFADGSVQALNAETMLTRWVSGAIDGSSNAQCAVRCADGVIYVETAASIGASGNASSGTVVALDEMTGAVRWQATNDSSGYNWSGTLVSGSFAVAGDTAGTLHAFDATTGSEIASLSLGASPVNSDPVQYDGKILVMTRDGVLHVVVMGANGSLAQVAELKVLGGCKAAPTVTGSRAIIVGSSVDGTSSALAVVDLSTMRIERVVTQANGEALSLGLGGISAPALVSTQADGTYCYFALNDAVATDKTYTSYSSGGDVFAYRLGDEEASLFYQPAGSNAQYCDYPLICDAAGNLYYLNDSGWLVRLMAANRPSRPKAPSSGTGGNASSGGGSTTPGEAGSAAATSTDSGTLVSNLSDAWSLASNVSDGAAANGAQSALVSGSASNSAGAASGVVTEDGTARATSDSVARGALPIWPVIGMAAGVVTLLVVLVSRRRRGEER